MEGTCPRMSGPLTSENCRGVTGIGRPVVYVHVQSVSGSTPVPSVTVRVHRCPFMNVTGEGLQKNPHIAKTGTAPEKDLLGPA